MEPLFRVNENGQLEEAVFQVADEAALQQELDQLQNELNQATEVHASAVQVAAAAQDDLNVATANKEAAAAALTKSEARAQAATRARELSHEQSQSAEATGVDSVVADQSGTDQENVGGDEQSVPVRLATDAVE